MDLENEWRAIRGNERSYSLNREDAKLIEVILNEGSTKLSPDGRRKRNPIDVDFLLDVCDRIAVMLTRNAQSVEEVETVKNKLRLFMTKALNDHGNVPQYAMDRINALITNANAGSGYYLKSRDKYIWAKAIAHEIDEFVFRWERIFNHMNDLRERELRMDILDAYMQKVNLDDPIDLYVEEQLAGNSRYQDLIEQKKQLDDEIEAQKEADRASMLKANCASVEDDDISQSDFHSAALLPKLIEIEQKTDQINAEMDQIIKDALQDYLSKTPSDRNNAVKEFYLSPAEVLLNQAIELTDSELLPLES